MHDFKKIFTSSCLLLLVASVALAAGTQLLEQRAIDLLAQSEEVLAAVEACPDGQCPGSEKLVFQLKETEQAIGLLLADIQSSKTVDAALLRAQAATVEADEVVDEAKTIVRFWEETW